MRRGKRINSAVKVRAPEARGFKYLLDVMPLLGRLRDSGCGRDAAGNRTLFFDQYVALELVALFSPAVDSMQAICRSSDTGKVRRKLGVKHVSLGSFSESSHVFDPDLLLGVIAELGTKLNPAGRDERLVEGMKGIGHVLTAVDATLLKALPKMARAMWADNCDGTKRFAWLRP